MKLVVPHENMSLNPGLSNDVLSFCELNGDRHSISDLYAIYDFSSEVLILLAMTIPDYLDASFVSYHED